MWCKRYRAKRKRSDWTAGLPLCTFDSSDSRQMMFSSHRTTVPTRVLWIRSRGGGCAPCQSTIGTANIHQRSTHDRDSQHTPKIDAHQTTTSRIATILVAGMKINIFGQHGHVIKMMDVENTNVDNCQSRSNCNIYRVSPSRCFDDVLQCLPPVLKAPNIHAVISASKQVDPRIEAIVTDAWG